jgi:hypothetical protein
MNQLHRFFGNSRNHQPNKKTTDSHSPVQTAKESGKARLQMSRRIPLWMLSNPEEKLISSRQLVGSFSRVRQEAMIRAEHYYSPEAVKNEKPCASQANHQLP